MSDMSESSAEPYQYGRRPIWPVICLCVVPVVFFVVSGVLMAVFIAYNASGPARGFRGGATSTAVLPALQEQKMPNGSTLVLQEVTWGQLHQHQVMTRYQTSATHHTQDDRIVIWLSGRDAFGQVTDFGWWSHSVAVDENGNEIEDKDPRRYAFSNNSTSSGGGSRPMQPLGNRGSSNRYDYIVVSSTLKPFRHKGKNFKLRVYDTSGDVVAEFTIPNPRPKGGEYPVWEPTDLPITKQDGDLTVTLAQLRAVQTMTRGNKRIVSTVNLKSKIHKTINGAPAKDWSQSRLRFSDALGNEEGQSNCRLSHQEAAWQVDVTFHRNPTAKFDSSETWTTSIKGLPNKKYAERFLSPAGTIGDVKLELILIGAAGNRFYSNITPSQSGSSSYGGSVQVDGKGMHYTIKTQGNDNNPRYPGQPKPKPAGMTIDAPLPHLIVKVSGLTSDHHGPELVIVDDQKRPVKAYRASSPSHHVWFLDLKDDAKQIDVKFIVQEYKKFKFLIRPPKPRTFISGTTKPWTDAGHLAFLKRRIKRYQDSVVRQPNASNRNNLAWHYLIAPEELRDDKEALKLARSAVAEKPNELNTHTLGVALYRSKDYEEAAKRFRSDLANRKDGLKCFDLYLLALCEFQLGRKDEARKTYDRAVESQFKYGAVISQQQRRELHLFRAEAVQLFLGDSAETLLQRGQKLASQGKWEEARDAFEQIAAFYSEDQWYWYQYATLLAWLEDSKSHQQHCQAMLKRFGDAGDGNITERIVKSCLLVPTAKFDVAKLNELMDNSLAIAPKSVWFLLAKALLEYRSNNYEEALKWLQNAAEISGSASYPKASIELIEAMAHHRLNHPEESRKSFTTAFRVMDRFPKAPKLGVSWHDWLICQMLQREAESLLQNSATPEKVPATKP